MDQRIVFIIIGMAVVTYLPRLIPLIALSNMKMPKLIEKWLNYIPVSVFSALIFPAILIQNGKLSLSLSNSQIWASLICLIIILKSKNLALTVLTGIMVILIFENIIL